MTDQPHPADTLMDALGHLDRVQPETLRDPIRLLLRDAVGKSYRTRRPTPEMEHVAALASAIMEDRPEPATPSGDRTP